MEERKKKKEKKETRHTPGKSDSKRRGEKQEEEVLAGGRNDRGKRTNERRDYAVDRTPFRGFLMQNIFIGKRFYFRLFLPHHAHTFYSPSSRRHSDIFSNRSSSATLGDPIPEVIQINRPRPSTIRNGRLTHGMMAENAKFLEYASVYVYTAVCIYIYVLMCGTRFWNFRAGSDRKRTDTATRYWRAHVAVGGKTR